MNNHMTQPTASALVLDLYDAVLTGNVERARAVLTDDVVVHVPGSHALAGDHVGVDALFDFVERTRRSTDDGEHIDVLDVLEGSDHVAVYCRVSATRLGRPPLDNLTIHLARLDAGRVAEITLHNRDDRPVDDFWS